MRGLSFLAECNHEEAAAVPFELHQEGTGSGMRHRRVIKGLRSALAGFDLPNIGLRNSDLKVPNAVAVAKQKILAPSVVAVVRRIVLKKNRMLSRASHDRYR